MLNKNTNYRLNMYNLCKNWYHDLPSKSKQMSLEDLDDDIQRLISVRTW